MKHLLLLHFFLLSVASAQEPTPEQVAIMQQEMACADGDKSTKILVIEEVPSSTSSPDKVLAGVKIILKDYYGEIKEFTTDSNGQSDKIPLMLCDTLIISKSGYSTITLDSGDIFGSEDIPLKTVRLQVDSTSSANSILSNDETSNQSEIVTQQNIPVNIETGYKGFLWGTSIESNISNNFTPLQLSSSDSLNKTFSGKLGIDSVLISYAFADSGFWKVEIDFIIPQNNIEKQISNFRRLEKNISAVYGVPKMVNQKESGVSSAFSDHLNQKFSRAFYRSSWDVNPAIIELYLNGNVLLPNSDLSLFSGNFSVLKLVYYNPDYMHSSQKLPAKEVIPSIFDIY